MKQAAEVPSKEIELAIRRKRPFAADPERHTYKENDLMAKKTPTTDAVKILQRRYYDKSRARALDLETARLNAAIAREIYTLRKKARLTQAQLARLVGTTGSVISRLEDDDYEGHSLKMLQRICAAMNCRVEIRFRQNRSSMTTAS